MTDSPASEPRQRVLLVTGLLGAGKSTALKVLEDLGWETIDNFPIRLLGRLIDSPDGSGSEVRAPLAIGFDSRTRGFDPNQVIERVKRLVQRPGIELTTLFLDCSGQELERRYNETRRRHPLAQDIAGCQRHRRRARDDGTVAALGRHGDLHHRFYLQ